MNFKLLNPSKYLSGADLKGDTLVTIKRIDLEEMEGENDKKQTKGLFTLVEFEKPWLANVTNATCIAAMFGDETDKWLGKRVVVGPERVMAFGKWELGVRVRGSPDLAAPVTVRLKLRKKKEQVLTMLPTKAPGTNGAKPAASALQPGTVTFGEKEGWKGKPIASFDTPTLNTIIASGEKACADYPAAPWVGKTKACIAEIRDVIERRAVPEPPPDVPLPTAQEDAPF
jgi:hypothetical protein